MSDSAPAHLLAANRRWAAAMKKQDAKFFSRLARGQTPGILWIGCADSRVPATQITGAMPGEMFVHRNIANVAAPDDLSCQAVIQYAVEMLQVRHIIVCGHYGCGGVAAALEDKPLGRIDGWLDPIKALRRAHADTLEAAPEKRRADLLCELNVRAQLRNVAAADAVCQAWAQGRALPLHGWIYNMRDGLIKTLETIEAPPCV